MTFLISIFLLSGFTEKWTIPDGVVSRGGRLLIGDADRDGHQEFYIGTYGGSQKIYIYELHLPDIWEVDSFPYYWGPLIWDIGDFDIDGFWDIVIHTTTYGYPETVISIAESPDSLSYPTQEVWRDTVGPPLVLPICSYDIDRDSLPEIVKVQGDYIHLHIYESIGDNTYDKIAEITTTAMSNASSTIAFGDFDSDSLNEFIWGYTAGRYSIWECIGNNSYQEISLEQLPTVNIFDCFSVADADQDGKDEFVIKGYYVSGPIAAYIFEAIGNDTYDIVSSFSVPGGDYYGGLSDAGDVDGDSVPEIVLEARQNVFIIKATSNDSFYIWDTLPGYSGGSNIRIYDIDGNGLNEIIVSNSTITRIYEYDGGGVEERTSSCMEPIPVSISPNPFKDQTTIKYQMFGSMDQNMLADASIQIFDVTGCLVKHLSVSTAYSLQPTVFTWDGIDQLNRKVPPGIYYVVLKNSNRIITKKIIKIQ